MASLAINALVAVGFLAVMKWQNKLGGLLASPLLHPPFFFPERTHTINICF